MRRRLWKREADDSQTIVVRVPAGEHVRLRIEAEGVARVEGDAAKLAAELYENAANRLRASKRRHGMAELVGEARGAQLAHDRAVEAQLPELDPDPQGEPGWMIERATGLRVYSSRWL